MVICGHERTVRPTGTQSALSGADLSFHQPVCFSGNLDPGQAAEAVASDALSPIADWFALNICWVLAGQAALWLVGLVCLVVLHNCVQRVAVLVARWRSWLEFVTTYGTKARTAAFSGAGWSWARLTCCFRLLLGSCWFDFIGLLACSLELCDARS
ncbi:hypothetical protein VTK56DRAFT_6604 [Thermocarpiscus australiensis]